MPLQASQIADLVTTTQRDLGRMKFTDISFDLQDYVAASRLIDANKVGFQSGYEIQFNVMVANSGAARNTGLYAQDSTNVGDVMALAQVPWRHVTTSYAFEHREISMNREPARIVELIKTRRHDAMLSKVERLETDFWGVPTDANDTTTPWGLGYWATSNATEGFNGGAAFGSTVAGLNPTTYGNWKNWTARYTDVSKTDLIRKMRKAATYTGFKPPVKHADYDTGTKYGIYTNYDVLGTLEEILEQQNDSLGNDVASKDGMTLFRRMPVVWVPQLDSFSDDPVFGIDWGVFKPIFLKGEYMRESAPRESALSHNTYEVFVDSSYNYKCTNRRKLWRIDTGA